MTLDIVRANPDAFVGLRVGLEFKNYQENLKIILNRCLIDPNKNFIITPMVPPRNLYYGPTHDRNQIHLLPDLVLPSESWWAHVATSIQSMPLKLFDELLKHALYLPTPVVVIDCPESRIAQKSMAAIINRNLKDNAARKFVLFRITLGKKSSQNYAPRVHQFKSQPYQSKLEELTLESNGESGLISSSFSKFDCRNVSHEFAQDGWLFWNTFRSLLIPDERIGVCLEINKNMNTDGEEFNRWTGEPVRLIVLHVDAFSSTKAIDTPTRLVGRIREYMRTLALANSLKTGFVVKVKNGLDMREYLKCLSFFCDMLERDHQDFYRPYDDTLSDPLQPLSKSLDSSTYQIFEHDKAKYTNYGKAIYKAMMTLMMRYTSSRRNRFIAMVLGAGRGPLVDAVIRAINGLKLDKVYFKIYALDKNHSSVRSLLYKKLHFWNRHMPAIQIEVVEADMRVWKPEDKADIIVTELLGSLSDNELSPECIDGCWRFSTPQTICIPQSYSSYIVPIMSYRMEQQVYRHSRLYTLSANIRDSLQVVRLTNFYPIAKEQELFTFNHHDISKESLEGANRREKVLKFTAKVDAVCHGFAGYLIANLFKSVSISTIPSSRTPTMESWFSAFIPIDKPINLPANTCLEIKFSRKDSPDKVWYEWQILKPIKSRIHSLGGNGTAMSKII